MPSLYPLKLLKLSRVCPAFPRKSVSVLPLALEGDVSSRYTLGAYLYDARD